MKNFVSTQTVKVAIISFILIAAFTTMRNVHAHDDHDQTSGEYTDVYLTDYHSHNSIGKQHRHAVRETPSIHLQGVVHDKLDLWQEHEHETPTEDDGIYLLPLYSVSGSTHTHNERSHTHAVLYARSSDKIFPLRFCRN